MKIALFAAWTLFLVPRCWAVSLDVPKTWKVDSPPAAGTKFSVSHENDAVLMVIERAKQDVDGQTLPEALAYLTNGMKAQPSYANESKIEPIKAGNLAGIFVTFDLTMPDQHGIKVPMRYQCALFLHEDKYLFVMASARPKVFPNFKQDFDAMLQTMEP